MFWPIMAGKRRLKRFESIQFLFLQRSPAALWPRKQLRSSLEVHWPNGLVESFKHLPINQLVTLREGTGQVANRGWSKV